MISQPHDPPDTLCAQSTGTIDPRPAVDLRRTAGRELCDTMVIRARWLMPEDRELVRLHFGEGETAVALARLVDISPKRMRMRLRRLAERMLSHRYKAVLRGRDLWPQRRQNVARAVVLEGRTFRAASVHLHLTLHQVRREMGIVDAIIIAQAQYSAMQAGEVAA